MFNLNHVPQIQQVVISGKSLNVLIVDDSKIIPSAITEILEIGNIQVTEACYGKETLKSNNNSPDLVLLNANSEFMQGNYFSKPVSADEFDAHLKKINQRLFKDKSPELIIGAA